jgi:single-strand DNA-binding protein
MATKTKTSNPMKKTDSENRTGRRSSDASISRINMIGRLVSDPVLRYTANGTAVANFRVAVNNGDEPNFFDIVTWRRQAEVTAEYLTKGRLVYIGGTPKGRTWIGRDGVKRYTLDIVASELRFLSPRPRPAGAAAAETPVAA